MLITNYGPDQASEMVSECICEAHLNPFRMGSNNMIENSEPDKLPLYVKAILYKVCQSALLVS